jgi:nesprin-1
LRERALAFKERVGLFGQATSERFVQLEQTKPAEVDRHVAILELLSEKVLAAMEDKENEAKRARTVRYEYHRDVEQVQSWICQAEGRVQDRSLEPQTLKDFLQELQCEIGLITDQMDRVSRHGTLICQRTRDEHEQQLVRTTLSNLTDQLQQVRAWLEEKKLQVGDSIDSWQRFLQLHSLVVSWVDEKKSFLDEPLHLTSLVQARQKSQDYTIAVKSCKIATKNVSDMGKELSRISQVSSVGILADQMAEAEQSKSEVETSLQERVCILTYFFKLRFEI